MHITNIYLLIMLKIFNILQQKSIYKYKKYLLYSYTKKYQTNLFTYIFVTT